MPAPERTCRQAALTVPGPTGSELPESERPFLREFLEAADRVKFAALAPEAGLLEQAIESARKLVESTRPADSEGGAK